MSKKPKRIALYVRTSTANGQTTRNQERELQDVAERTAGRWWRSIVTKASAVPRDAINAPASISCWQRLPARRSTWSPHGVSTGWGAR